jgi:hypothetical protein
VLCTDSPQTDTLKLYCWDDPTPRTACYNDDPSACMFSYSWSVTPKVTAASPAVGASGDVLILQGNAFDDVKELLLAATWGTASCPVVDKHSTNMSCIVPDMPAGQYRVSAAVGQSGRPTARQCAPAPHCVPTTGPGVVRSRGPVCDICLAVAVAVLQVRVQKASGEYGVDSRPFLPARFSYSPIITAVEDNVGSVQGGRLLKLMSPAAAFNTTHTAQNTVRR